MSLENVTRITEEIGIDTTISDTTKIVPMDDIILEIVWSDEHSRLICVARLL